MIFIAWSKETEEIATRLRDHLDRRGFEVWLSDQIDPGRRFREDIRRSVLGAHVVLSVFPEKPSPWQIAEAGLAYFENKLLPVAVDSTMTIEPFSELETLRLATEDLDRDEGPTLDALAAALRARIGDDRDGLFKSGFVVFANRFFYLGTPLAGIALMLLVVLFGMGAHDGSGRYEFLRAGHTAFGAAVFGGGAFIALLFARAGTSASYSARRFGFVIAKALFILWFWIAVLQFVLGAMLWAEIGFNPSHQHWLWIAALLYLVSLFFWGGGYVLHSSAFRHDREQASIRSIHLRSFYGNACFGTGLVLLTLVILAMSLKERLHDLLTLSTGAG